MMDLAVLWPGAYQRKSPGALAPGWEKRNRGFPIGQKRTARRGRCFKPLCFMYKISETGTNKVVMFGLVSRLDRSSKPHRKHHTMIWRTGRRFKLGRKFKRVYRVQILQTMWREETRTQEIDQPCWDILF